MSRSKRQAALLSPEVKALNNLGEGSGQNVCLIGLNSASEIIMFYTQPRETPNSCWCSMVGWLGDGVEAIRIRDPFSKCGPGRDPSLKRPCQNSLSTTSTAPKEPWCPPVCLARSALDFFDLSHFLSST